MAALDQITLNGFKSIRELKDFKLEELNVLVGANGAGKSNLVDFFRLLRAMADGGLQSFVTKGGKPWLSFGVMGGDTQPQGQAQVLINVIDFGMDIQQAGDAPRVRHAGSSDPTGVKMAGGGLLSVELGIDPAVVRQLQELGHKINPAGYLDFFGGYQAIQLDTLSGMYHGASDPRRAGCAFGY